MLQKLLGKESNFFSSFLLFDGPINVSASVLAESIRDAAKNLGLSITEGPRYDKNASATGEQVFVGTIDGIEIQWIYFNSSFPAHLFGSTMEWNYDRSAAARSKDVLCLIERPAETDARIRNHAHRRARAITCATLGTINLMEPICVAWSPGMSCVPAEIIKLYSPLIKFEPFTHLWLEWVPEKEADLCFKSCGLKVFLGHEIKVSCEGMNERDPICLVGHTIASMAIDGRLKLPATGSFTDHFHKPVVCDVTTDGDLRRIRVRETS